MPSETIQNTKITPAFLQGGGEMGALIREYDWDNHPLGKPEDWPDNLKITVRMMLNSAFPMFVWWSADLYMFHNDAYLPALGNKHPKALGSRASLMWAEIWDTVGKVAEDILENGSQFYAEELYLVLERKGFPEETYWTFSYSPAFDDNGNVNGVFCACTEVTKTVLSQRRIRTLKEISDATALVQTLEQACQTASDILSQNHQDIPFNLIYLFNAQSTEFGLVGKAGTVTDNAAPGLIKLNAGANDLPLNALLNTKQPVVLDYQMADTATIEIAPGLRVPAKAVMLPILRPGQDDIIGLCISGISDKLEYDADYLGFHQLLVGQVATSITSVQARQEGFRQQQYLNEIFQQAPVGITILRGPDYIIDLANPGVCEIWGRKQEDLLGKTVLEALPEVADQGIKELLDSVYYTGVPFVANELPVSFDRDGKLEEVYLNFVYHPMRDPAGQITGIIAVAIDINEQVEARRKIEEMNRELLGINADLDNFVYSASHDLKAPISNIEGLMRALVDYLPAEVVQSEKEIPRVLNLIQNSVDRFKRAIADLTEVAKIQRDSGEDVARVNLKAVTEDVKLDFERLIREKEATIDVQFGEHAVVEFSAKNARSIVYNLLSNALKYSSPDRKPLINVTVETTPDFTVLCVADNGLGFDPADENKIFGMFKRLHDHVEGSGIGLYIVKRILENAGGRIELDSEPDKGSTFKVYFKRL
ncbi:sensor histidine kinase [Pontibacter pudoricolor]|uniref:sensor histidine kinase n=1 Tax=Pontibacter pudoricolor TaxID=2694930 RepID=UPI001EE3CE71|nr:PAS domain-containing sensor histidine kinase [Pontibacter pudoricolor]